MADIYLEYHITEYPEKSGRRFKFDPYLFGKGAWIILGPDNRDRNYAPKSLQKKLNEHFFKRSELPSLYERIKNASKPEREQLKDISMSWLQQKITSLRKGTEIQDLDVIRSKSGFTVGGLYLYFYDAKHKATLPMWDRFPLTIVLNRTSTGFLGLNLHYFSMNERSILLAKILQSNSVYNKSTDTLKANLTYDTLKGSKTYYKGFEKGIKEYLYSHVQSKILPIESHEWPYAILLPLEDFQYNK
jgi:hypothetical protein